MEITYLIPNVTGVAASTTIKIRRSADGYLIDWDDNVFKSSGWGNVTDTLDEVDATNLPGLYNKVVSVTAWNDGFYQAIADYNALSDIGTFYLKDGAEIIESIGITSPGAINWSYTLTRTDNGFPIPDVDVWVTTDIAGTNVIASGVTDQTGVVSFQLDAGTVYVWRQKSGFNFTNPDIEVVS